MAARGFLVLVPDFFHGDPVVPDMDPELRDSWFVRHDAVRGRPLPPSGFFVSSVVHHAQIAIALYSLRSFNRVCHWERRRVWFTN